MNSTRTYRGLSHFSHKPKAMGKAQSSFQGLPLSLQAPGGCKVSSSKSLLERWQFCLLNLDVPRCLTRTVHVLELTTISPAAARLTESYKADEGFMNSAGSFNQRVWHPPGPSQENSLWRRVCTDTGVVRCGCPRENCAYTHICTHWKNTGHLCPVSISLFKVVKASRVHYLPCLLPLVLFLKVCLSRVWLCYWNLIPWLKSAR